MPKKGGLNSILRLAACFLISHVFLRAWNHRNGQINNVIDFFVYNLLRSAIKIIYIVFSFHTTKLPDFKFQIFCLQIELYWTTTRYQMVFNVGKHLFPTSIIALAFKPHRKI